jgi:hypothetical protein
MIRWIHVALGAAAILCGAESIGYYNDSHTGLICIVMGLAIMAYGVPPNGNKKDKEE